MANQRDATIGLARQLVGMVEGRVEGELEDGGDFGDLIKLAHLQVQLSIAESLHEIAGNGIFITPR